MSEQRNRREAPRAEVLRLYYIEGLSIRAISKRLKIARKTVRRALGRPVGKRDAPPAPPRPSLLDPYIDTIRAELAECPELRAPAMLERLRPLGYTGGLSILRERMRELRPTPHQEAFLTLDFAPGQVVLVDWADFGFALPGVPRRVSAFVMVLGYSRMLYVEFVLSQKMGSFLRCMERGLRFFGGVTLSDVFDNMKTVVLEHDPPRDPVFNPVFVEYAARRGFAIQACTPGEAHQKGGVERGIGFIRTRFWPGRRFSSLADLNRQATVWRDTFANAREHELTGKVPQLVFEHEEKRHLKPLPDRPFDTDDRDTATVNKSFRIRFDRNRYSVPWRLVGQPVTVRADDDHVRVFLGPKQVAVHPRCWDIGQDIKHDSHERGLREQKPRSAASELPHALEATGETGRRYFQVLAAGSRSVRRETLRLTLLVELFGAAVTTEAIDEVMRTGHVGCEYVEYVLRHKKKLTPAAPPLRLGDVELDSITVAEPDLAIYDNGPPTPMTRDPGTPAPLPDRSHDDD